MKKWVRGGGDGDLYRLLPVLLLNVDLKVVGRFEAWWL